MKIIWISILLFTVAGCQPDAQDEPVQQPTVVDEKADPKSEPIAIPAAPLQLPAETVSKPRPPTEFTPKQKPVSAPPAHVQDAAGIVAPASPEKPAATEPPATTPVPRALLSEADAMTLARKKNCFACHALDKKVVGPAWRDVAGKYRGDAAAQSLLEAKVRNGGKGNWGSVAMPAQPALTNEELRGLVQFVLQLQ